MTLRIRIHVARSLAAGVRRGTHPVLLLWFRSRRPQWLKMIPGHIVFGIQHPAAVAAQSPCQFCIYCMDMSGQHAMCTGINSDKFVGDFSATGLYDHHEPLAHTHAFDRARIIIQ
jgi:hypothetical protein